MSNSDLSRTSCVNLNLISLCTWEQAVNGSEGIDVILLLTKFLNYFLDIHLGG